MPGIAEIDLAAVRMDAGPFPGVPTCLTCCTSFTSIGARHASSGHAGISGTFIGFSFSSL
jgi:hypothetical protein